MRNRDSPRASAHDAMRGALLSPATLLPYGMSSAAAWGSLGGRNTLSLSHGRLGVCAVAACLTACASAQAQTGGSERTRAAETVECAEYLIRAWDFKQGLPSSSVTAITQDHDGYLWAGTFGGLVRFDGVRFDVFRPQNTPHLPGAGVVDLLLDSSGRLWVSTIDGLAVREGSTWRRMGAEDGWTTAEPVRSFAQGTDGAILASTFDARFFEYKGDSWNELPQPPGSPLLALCAADGQGRWWIARAGALSVWQESAWTPIARFPETMEGFGCTSARDGGVWAIIGPSLRKYQDGAEVHRLELPDLPTVTCPRGLYHLQS